MRGEHYSCTSSSSFFQLVQGFDPVTLKSKACISNLSGQRGEVLVTAWLNKDRKGVSLNEYLLMLHNAHVPMVVAFEEQSNPRCSNGNTAASQLPG